MSHCRPFALVACGLLLFTFSACDDPSGVGLNVGPRGFEGGTPVTVDIEPTTFGITAADDVTGNSARVLVGRVEDPAIGTTETTGYVDVLPPSSLPENFVDATVQKAELVLIPDEEPYVYGDTLQSQQLAVYDMPNEWDASGRTVDETLSPGALLTESASFTPGDTVTIELPTSWVSSHALSDTADFDADFHGVQLQPTGGNAVVGYRSNASHLRVIASDDTAAYPVSKTFTAIDRSDAPYSEDWILMQDGVERILSFDFLLPDSLKNTPISRAVLHLRTDTSLFEPVSTPADFVRPRTNVLYVQGFLEDSEEDSAPAFLVPVLESDTLNANGHFAFSQGEDLLSNPRARRTVSLLQLFQRITLGKPSIDRYRVRLSQASNTINPLLFFRPGTGENAPRVSLTITQADE